MAASREIVQRVRESELQELLGFVRLKSPYFCELWKDIPLGAPLTAYPLVDHESYWDAADSAVLTGAHVDGVVYKSGGTTGRPKLSLVPHEEMVRGASALAKHLQLSDVRPGDRIANLLYIGDMYSSFLGISDGIYALGSCVHLPIAGHTPLETVVELLEDFEATVVVSIVTVVHGIAIKAKKPLSHIRLLLYGGEAMYDDQMIRIKEIFPCAEIKSLAYGATESGIIGLCAGQEDNRVHFANEPDIVVEIVDDEGQAIIENGIEGRILVTSLVKRLMPVVRYPSGDLGQWVDFERRIFRLQGRDQVGIRLGPVSLDLYDIRRAVKLALGEANFDGMQVVLERADAKDWMLFRIVGSIANVSDAQVAISGEICRAKPMYEEHVRLGLIGPLKVEKLEFSDLETKQRTGKTIEIVDKRFVDAPAKDVEDVKS